MTAPKRRARPAAEWQKVRKDLTTTDALTEAGKAPPAQIQGREYPGERVKVPPIQDADTSEEITLPRTKKCDCQGVTKCACQQKATEQPVRKPLPTPSAGQSKDDFVSSCMASLNSDYPDEKQRAAICYAQWGEKTAKTDDVSKSYWHPILKSNEKHEGVMIALVAPSHIAKKLAQPDGEKPDDMHVTLGYYGKVGKDIGEEHVQAMHKCVAKAAAGYSPIKAHVGGVGRFNSSSSTDGKDVLIAHVDSPGLHDVRDHLIAEVHKCAGVIKAESKDAPNGPKPLATHGYTPHITLAYIDPESPMPIHKLEREEFTFTHLVVAAGGQKQLYPLGEEAGVTKSIWCSIVKADDAQRLVTGIVLQPEVVDAQGDIIAADVIAKAAHNFLSMYNKKTQLGLQHEVFGPDGVELVESWIAPVDMTINDRLIKAGTWMMTVRCKGDAIWNKVKAGGFTGFSIGGVAKVQRLAA